MPLPLAAKFVQAAPQLTVLFHELFYVKCNTASSSTGLVL